MKHVVTDDKYGTIEFNENFWTGKKQITMNGQALTKENRTTYSLTTEQGKTVCNLKGNYILGAKLVIGNDSIQISPAAKWYEYTFAILTFVLILIWGNSVALCKIIPVVGGAIGGGISALMAFTSLVLMKGEGKVWAKILIGIGMLIATFLLCFLIALIILSIL